jgi:hypothetical protein
VLIRLGLDYILFSEIVLYHRKFGHAAY